MMYPDTGGRNIQQEEKGFRMADIGDKRHENEKKAVPHKVRVL